MKSCSTNKENKPMCKIQPSKRTSKNRYHINELAQPLNIDEIKIHTKYTEALQNPNIDKDVFNNWYGEPTEERVVIKEYVPEKEDVPPKNTPCKRKQQPSNKAKTTPSTKINVFSYQSTGDSSKKGDKLQFACNDKCDVEKDNALVEKIAALIQQIKIE